jgi:hypothetical protein
MGERWHAKRDGAGDDGEETELAQYIAPEGSALPLWCSFTVVSSSCTIVPLSVTRCARATSPPPFVYGPETRVTTFGHMGDTYPLRRSRADEGGADAMAGYVSD